MKTRFVQQLENQVLHMYLGPKVGNYKMSIDRMFIGRIKIENQDFLSDFSGLVLSDAQPRIEGLISEGS